MKAYLLVVITILGVLGLWIDKFHEKRVVAKAQEQSLTAQKAVKNLNQAIANLTATNVIHSTQLVQKTVEIPELHSVYAIKDTNLKKLLTEPEHQVSLVAHTIQVPTAAAASQAPIAAQIKPLQDQLESATRPAATKQTIDQAGLVFGMTRSSVAFVFSIVIIAASLYIIFSGKFPQTHEKWAFSSIGTIIGYWLGS